MRSARGSMLVSNKDTEQYSTFKARRETEKEAKRALLAKEFPLLFGPDTKSRSTIGKYANKTLSASSHNPITLGKRKMQSILDVKPVVDENVDGNGTTKIADKRANQMVKIDKGKDQTKSCIFGKTVQSPNKKARQTIAATANSRGSFLNYGGFSSRKRKLIDREVEMFGQGKESKVSESTIQKEFSFSQLENINTVRKDIDDVFDEQMTDVLDYLLETNEVDQVMHRRLSSQEFHKDTIRRLSMRASLSVEEVNITTATVSEKTQEPQELHENSSFAVNDASFEIDDMDVLQALRTYISTLDGVATTSTDAVTALSKSSRGAMNGFASPTPNTQVISITSPIGSHFKRPKQMSSPNPIRFGSRHRRESGLDVEIPSNELRTAVKTPPTTKNHKSIQPISPNPMRLVDTFYRGGFSGRKSSRNSMMPQQILNPVEDEVLGLKTNFDEPSIHEDTSNITFTSAQIKKKPKKQRRRSSAAGQLPHKFDYTQDSDDIFGPTASRKSILNSPSLKTMRVSFITNDQSENNGAKGTSTAAISSHFSSSEMMTVIEESSSLSGKNPFSTASLVAILDTIIDAPISPPVDALEEEIISIVSESTTSMLITSSTSTTEKNENIATNVLENSEVIPKDEVESKTLPLPVSEMVISSTTDASTEVVKSTVATIQITAPEVKQQNEKETVIFFPRQIIYLDAMKKGVVVAELSRSMHSVSDNKSLQLQQPQHNVRYMIHVSMLPLPGNSDAYEHINMVLIKRFSEFRQFHQKLVACPGVNIERIPVIPAREIASFGGGSTDADYLKGHEKCLRNWLEAVFLRQSFENDAYRLVLLDFLSQ